MRAVVMMAFDVLARGADETGEKWSGILPHPESGFFMKSGKPLTVSAASWILASNLTRSFSNAERQKKTAELSAKVSSLVAVWPETRAGAKRSEGGARSKWTLLSDLLISDAGLLAGSLAVSPLVKIPPAAFGIASLYGATGSAVFSLAAALFTSNQAGAHPIAAANVAGTIVGLGVGILGAATWHRNLYAGSSGSSEPLELRLAGVPLPQIVPLLGHGTTGLSLIWR